MAANARTTTSVYLSTDNVITTGDIRLFGWWGTLNLAAGAQTTMGPTTWTVPLTVAAGTYYAGVITDTDGVIPETNEANNAGVGNQVTVP